MSPLTEAEKQKIVEEERIRAEERAKYTQPPSDKRSAKKNVPTGISLLIIFAAIIGIPMILSSSGIGSSSKKTPVPTVDVAVKAAQTETLSKIELVNPRIEKNIIDQEELQLTIKNKTGKDIDGIRFAGKFQNNFGEDVTDWSNNRTYRSGYQGLIKAGASNAVSEQLVTWRNPSKVIDLHVTQVHFVDGENVEIE